MNCPVCKTLVEENASMCPHCQSDLEIYQLIIKSNQQRQTQRKIISALGIFAAVTAIGWASSGIFSKGNSETSPAVVEEVCPDVPLLGETRPKPSDSIMMDELCKENDALKAENASLAAKINSPANAVKKMAAKKVAKKRRHHKKSK
ncbi:MAG: hypothetical protein HY063_06500 [Bacteroidetes bacterium]|nr:hypothetical protein [Bacteroidota bacterium]